MKAIHQETYGEPSQVLRLVDRPTPTPADHQVLVRILAASVHPDIWHVVTGRPWVLRLMGSGLRRPRPGIPGTDFAGRIEAVGPQVTRYKVGDEVFGENLAKMQWRHGAVFAELATVHEDCLTRKPAGLSFAEAAAVPTAGIIVLTNLKSGRLVKPGMQVLVNGAGGGVGGMAVQLLKAWGAEVTAVDRTEKLDLLRALGADHVLDYTRGDVLAGGQRYDLIFDVASTLSFPDCRRALAPEGKYILIGHDHFGKGAGRVFGSITRFLRLAVLTLFYRKQLPDLDISQPDKQESLALLRDLMEKGAVRPVIDRTYPLEQVVDALRHLQEGTARGRIVVTP